MVKPWEVAVFVGAAILGAVISNGAAAPARRLAWVGDYPNAGTVPPPAAASPQSAASASSAPTSAASTSTPGAVADYPPHPERPWVAITGEQAEALFRQGIPFLDARRTAVYIEGHVAGARSFPIWESTVDEAVKRLFEEGYDVNAPLVVYCSGGDCEDSHMLGERLHRFGFNNALVYAGGFPDWEKRRLPIEKGAPR